MHNNRRWVVVALAAAVILTGGLPLRAVAGPILKFGPNEEGLLKLDYAAQFQLNVRDTGSGDEGDDATAEFNFRRNRLLLVGAWGQHVGFYAQTEFLEDRNIGTLDESDGDTAEFQMLDAQLRLKYSDALQARIGKFKYNLTRENLEACFEPLNLDRSLFLRAPLVDEGTRDKGVAVWGTLFDKRVKYAVDVMNGRNDAASAPSSGLRYSARAHLSLLDPEAGYGYKGTYRGNKKVFTVGGAVQFENDVAYADVANRTDAKDYFAWTADAFAEIPVAGIGTFTAAVAYVDYDLDDAYQGADPDPEVIGLTGEKHGGYAKVAYLLPQLPLQFYLRGEQWTFANLNGIYDQDLTWYGGGANYYFRGQNLKLTVEYARTDFDQERTVDDVVTEDFGTFTTQVQFIF